MSSLNAIQQKMIQALAEVGMTIHKIGTFKAGQQRLPMHEGDGDPDVQGQRPRVPMSNFHKTIKTFP